MLSSVPPPPRPGLAKTTARGGEIPRSLRLVSPKRHAAREVEVGMLAPLLAKLTDRDLSDLLDVRSLREAAEVRTGRKPITAAEVALILPVNIGVVHLVALARERVARDLADHMTTANDVMQLRVVLSHLDAILAFFALSSSRVA